MNKRIAIIQGHPDTREDHFCHALAEAYARGAEEAGHQVRHVMVAQLEFPMLHSKEEWQNGPVPESIQAAQEAIAWADHLFIVHPLWLGSMPATFKAFLEQVFRPGFAIDSARHGWKQRLKGRSARLVVTMGMPALLYRLFFFAHGVRAMARNVLKFSGIAPVRSTLIGMVEAQKGKQAGKWIPRMHALGVAAR